MEITRPDYYKEFSCIAGACPDTCCAGWQIVIDDKSPVSYTHLYTFDTFNPERYSTSRPYRHQIAFLCRMLKDTGSLELPAELTGLKLTHGSGNNKDKRML